MRTSNWVFPVIAAISLSGRGFSDQTSHHASFVEERPPVVESKGGSSYIQSVVRAVPDPQPAPVGRGILPSVPLNFVKLVYGGPRPSKAGVEQVSDGLLRIATSLPSTVSPPAPSSSVTRPLKNKDGKTVGTAVPDIMSSDGKEATAVRLSPGDSYTINGTTFQQGPPSGPATTYQLYSPFDATGKTVATSAGNDQPERGIRVWQDGEKTMAEYYKYGDGGLSLAKASTTTSSRTRDLIKMSAELEEYMKANGRSDYLDELSQSALKARDTAIGLFQEMRKARQENDARKLPELEKKVVAAGEDAIKSARKIKDALKDPATAEARADEQKQEGEKKKKEQEKKKADSPGAAASASMSLSGGASSQAEQTQ